MFYAVLKAEQAKFSMHLCEVSPTRMSVWPGQKSAVHLKEKIWNTEPSKTTWIYYRIHHAH